MTEDERKALAALRFNWAPVPDDVWRRSPYHVPGLHPGTEQTVLQGLTDAVASDDASPIGLVIQGQRGSGKTHLLGWVREQAHAQDGYFFLVSLLSAKGFWDSVVGSLNEGLARPVNGGESQLRTLLRRLGSAVRAPRAVRRAVLGETTLTAETLDRFVEHLRDLDELVGRECQETARALALLASPVPQLREIGETYLQSADDDYGDRPRWGMRRSPRVPELIVRDLSWLLALTGPTVIAVDQIDALIAQSVKSLAGGPDDQAPDAVLERIAGGLMAVRERTRRTLALVACLPDSWQLIKDRATDTVQDRFREASQLKTIPSPAVGRALVERRFAPYFERIGFRPPYPSWPVTPAAFDAAPGFTPRQLLILIDRHVQACVLDDQVRELSRFDRTPRAEPASSGPPAEVDQLGIIDARFTELSMADVANPLAEETEDAALPPLLSAGLTAWIVERGPAGVDFAQDPPPSARPALHARLRRTIDERTEDESHWAFRAIASRNAIAALNRLRKASTAAGLADGVPDRRLIVLRTAAWSDGPKTQAALADFASRGGVVRSLGHQEIRILGALRGLLTEKPPGLQAWLLDRQPASGLAIFRETLPLVDGDAAGTSHAAGTSRTADAGASAPPAVRRRIGPPADAGEQVRIGFPFDGGDPVGLDLEALRKHTAIFAGSGSGKTVLIRRLVEECALRGVSAIVLDPNNDLARLGDPWPAPPDGWWPGDAGLAADYLAHTDVVVWTPRREAGRPLVFQPLPDFSGVRDDPDEFGEAVEAAVASIAPRAKLDGRTHKAHLGLAVLRMAVRHYGRLGGNRLTGLVELLSALPAGVSDLENAEKIGGELAQTLTAAMVNDPLFGGSGTPADPGVLLTPPRGKRARVSVISFIGLPSEDQRQSFVNQLQMALFAWIKRHPAGDRPLGGLLVMDEAQTLAPSGALTACTQSTLMLAAQARKYGLGLVFATQAPKNLHNRISGNAATQFFGLLNAPVQIAAAREMAAAKGGDVPEISRLRSGQFYAAIEGGAFEKVRTPLCLSHHPRSPLTTEEVLDRSRIAPGR
ncbi:DUF87 domain-containing protein [Solwaraspora sp. WMMD1047]|uniref:helicase HerA domain-containing protein n=1 Tax=Solwaraspora sp. WMMD1047 TaxID=3016102 RepID=UPI002417CE97|nr:DUF87 domain-containing protein [Solwaraspora sp. WMMD1047]MDG4830899.1 DUF87 domain-containing protein [Solwaraspora sp. WMMD1047]